MPYNELSGYNSLGGEGDTVLFAVTEVLNSFSDFSALEIKEPGNLTLSVSEVLTSFSDYGEIKTPTKWQDKPLVNTIWTDR